MNAASGRSTRRAKTALTPAKRLVSLVSDFRRATDAGHSRLKESRRGNALFEQQKSNIPEMACASPFGVAILLPIAWSKLLSTLSCLALACCTWRVLVVQKTSFSVGNPVGEMCMICPVLVRQHVTRSTIDGLLLLGCRVSHSH